MKFQSLYEEALKIEKEHKAATIATRYIDTDPYYVVYPYFYDNIPGKSENIYYRGTIDKPASKYILEHWQEMEEDLL